MTTTPGSVGGEAAPPLLRRPNSSGTQRSWVFLTRTSLPVDPTARRLEKRGRWWLLLSYVLCPCHLPVTLTLAGLAFGGTAIGTAITGHAAWVGIVLTIAYAMVLWRGFHHLRRSKQVLAHGESLRCSSSGCEIVPAEASANQPGTSTAMA